jgi:CheY-like chemotaxis protein
MHILLVDAEFESRWLVSGWLGLFVDSVRIGTSASTAEALEMIDERCPDLVLASYRLAGLGELVGRIER